MAAARRAPEAVADVAEKDWMTSGEVARALNMTDAAIRRWAREGLIQAMKTPGGQYRIRRESLAQLMNVDNGRQARHLKRGRGRR